MPLYELTLKNLDNGKFKKILMGGLLDRSTISYIRNEIRITLNCLEIELKLLENKLIEENIEIIESKRKVVTKK